MDNNTTFNPCLGTKDKINELPIGSFLVATDSEQILVKTDESSSITIGGVKSINDKTGDITLSAEDVGALTEEDLADYATKAYVEDAIAENGSGVGQVTPEGGEIFNDYTNNQATGNYSHASGHGTKATATSQTVIGEYNATDDSAALLVGNGTTDSKRSNAFKVLKNGSAVIGEGETSGKGSIAAGTTDKALAESIVGSTLASMITLTPAKALAPLTIAYGANSSSVVPGAVTLGVENIAGVKGYYWDTIDFTNKKIKLSSTRRTTTLKNPTYITSLDWAVGDVISIVNDKFYSGQIKITAIDAQNSTITVDSLPFTEIAYTSTLTIYTYASPMDRTIYATYQRDKSSLSNKVKPLWASRNGTVNIGLGPMSLGIMNLATGSLSFVTGQDNWAAGESSAASGLNTQAIGNYSHAEGYKAVAQGLASHAEGSSTASGEKSHAEGGGTKAIGIYSHSEGISAEAQGHADHAEGDSTVAYGHAAHSEGKGTTARNIASHAEGSGTHATANMSHAEGTSTTASGVASHAEGSGSLAQGVASHAEGDQTKALHDYTHAEGSGGEASGKGSHKEGIGGIASGEAAHIEGKAELASGVGSHAEGSSTIASGVASHAEGGETTASGVFSHAGGTRSVASHVNAFAHGNNVKSSADDSAVFGKWNEGDSNNIFEVGVGTDDTNRKNGLSVTADGQILDKDGKKVANEDWVSEQIANIEMPEGSSGVGQATPEGGEIFNDYTNNQATGNYAHAEGISTTASGNASHAEGSSTASGEKSHAEGGGTQSIGIYSHAEGVSAKAQGHADHAEGDSAIAYGHAAHAEGKDTHAYNIASHAEGNNTHATANMSHAEGASTTASGVAAHAEGARGEASGDGSHKEGVDSTASGRAAHAQGDHTTASGEASHAGGCYSTASHDYSIVHGRQVKSGAIAGAYFGKYNAGDTSNIFEIGIGTSDTARKNAVSVDTDGNMDVAGTITSNGQEVATKAYVDDIAITGGTGSLANYYTKTEVDNKVKAKQQSSAKQLFLTGCESDGIAKMPYGRARITGDAAPYIDMGGGYKVNGTTVIDSEFIGGFWRGASKTFYDVNSDDVTDSNIKAGKYLVVAEYTEDGIVYTSEPHVLYLPSEEEKAFILQIEFKVGAQTVTASFTPWSFSNGVWAGLSISLDGADSLDNTFRIYTI